MASQLLKVCKHEKLDTKVELYLVVNPKHNEPENDQIGTLQNGSDRLPGMAKWTALILSNLFTHNLISHKQSEKNLNHTIFSLEHKVKFRLSFA